ncbi:hypothetical protein CC80DRAFT_498321 [Byssothecium circinans]|uniref:Probable double zinc ribbon domain-containing protein n=1 Tax=Byssothecium circinans TaxID=147558 RepID=A0A6A5T992_9PLEO|nr:hypothetical protein CC80DRAFT_498321 [Byssothecium circinans]
MCFNPIWRLYERNLNLLLHPYPGVFNTADIMRRPNPSTADPRKRQGMFIPGPVLLHGPSRLAVQEQPSPSPERPKDKGKQRATDKEVLEQEQAFAEEESSTALVPFLLRQSVILDGSKPSDPPTLEDSSPSAGTPNTVRRSVTVGKDEDLPESMKPLVDLKRRIAAANEEASRVTLALHDSSSPEDQEGLPIAPPRDTSSPLLPKKKPPVDPRLGTYLTNLGYTWNPLLGYPTCQPPLTIGLRRGWQDDDSEDDQPEEERAKWHCCKCGGHNRIWLIQHNAFPLGQLMCRCSHRGCQGCTFSGTVKPFVPMDDQAIIPVSEENGQVWFGSVCGYCGMANRAPVIKRHSKVLRKIPSMASLHNARLAVIDGGCGTLRKVRSTILPKSKRNFTPPDPSKQSPMAAVKFSGYECICTHLITLDCLTFQVTGKETKRVPGRPKTPPPPPKFFTTEELKARGHLEPIITTEKGGKKHWNPLRSNALEAGEIVAAKTLGILNGKLPY